MTSVQFGYPARRVLQPSVLTTMIVAGLGLLWNLYGVLQFSRTAFIPSAQLVAAGMTPEQADLYAGLPWWMTAAFAVGVFGGAIGCVALAVRRSSAVAVFAVSLSAYVVLFVGDAALGVFTAFGTPHAVVISLAVAIAAGLLGFATWAWR